MIAFRTLLMLFGALAALMLGAVATTALADGATPPCHETMAHPGADQPPAAPDDSIKAMGCCIACVATPTILPPERAVFVTPAPAPAARPLALPPGERPAPEPDPPRRRAA